MGSFNNYVDRIWLLLTTHLPLVLRQKKTFWTPFYYTYLSHVDIWLTTYPPLLVYVVIECPLTYTYKKGHCTLIFFLVLTHLSNTFHDTSKIWRGILWFWFISNFDSYKKGLNSLNQGIVIVWHTTKKMMSFWARASLLVALQGDSSWAVLPDAVSW